MNKIICCFTMLFALVAFGAANDTVVSFSTPGIDRYADGSRVRKGESYALIWTKNGATFGGLTSGCLPKLETDKVVMVAPLATRGRCPVTVVEIDANDAAQYAGGTFSLYLLDTRVKGADGKVSLAQYANGLPQVVNSFGLSAGSTKDFAVVNGVDGGMTDGASVQLGDVGVYTEIASPEITAMKIEGATIKIKVEGMDKAAKYFVVPGSTPSKFAPALSTQPDSNGVFAFPKPKDDSVQVYKVIGVRNF